MYQVSRFWGFWANHLEKRFQLNYVPVHIRPSAKVTQMLNDRFGGFNRKVALSRPPGRPVDASTRRINLRLRRLIAKTVR